MLYSSCKNGLVDSVQQKGILIDKKVRQQAQCSKVPAIKCIKTAYLFLG